MAIKLDILFNQKSFDRVFTRQPDEVSCTPACFATIARLYELPPDQDVSFFRGALKTRFEGTSELRIRQVAREYLPATKTGIDVYHGGIALASIRYKPSGDDHSVVFLAKKAREIIYYDPADHCIYHDDVLNMQRGSGDSRDNRWVANMKHVPGASFRFWKKLSVPNPYILRDQVFWLKEQGYKNFPR